MNKAYFIPHCENENCDLGSFEYQCPVCNKFVDDYEVWWEQDYIWNGSVFEFSCLKCKSLLNVVWNKDQYEYYVFDPKNKNIQS